jgi:hypothetical protein
MGTGRDSKEELRIAKNSMLLAVSNAMGVGKLAAAIQIAPSYGGYA